jgi:hypothetical protein
MIEIPRDRTANVWKLGLGSVLIAVRMGLIGEGLPVWAVAIGAFAPGSTLVASNVHLILVHPPQLRATGAGVSFAGGDVLPWHEIAAIYQAGVPLHQYGHAGRTQAIGFTFRRTRTLLRLPSTLWLSTPLLGDVWISTLAADQRPQVLVAQLDAMWRQAAAGDEDRRVPAAGALPTARVIKRA